MINVSVYLFTLGYFTSFTIFSWNEDHVHAYQSTSLMWKSQSWCTTGNVKKSHWFPLPPTFGIVRFLLIFFNQIGLKWYFIKCLVCIFWVTSVAEHFFLCLFSTGVSSSMKHLLISFACLHIFIHSSLLVSRNSLCISILIFC